MIRIPFHVTSTVSRTSCWSQLPREVNMGLAHVKEHPIITTEQLIWLVVQPTPLKNMSSSIGMMNFPIYGKITVMFQSPPTSHVTKVVLGWLSSMHGYYIYDNIILSVWSDYCDCFGWWMLIIQIIHGWLAQQVYRFTIGSFKACRSNDVAGAVAMPRLGLVSGLWQILWTVLILYSMVMDGNILGHHFSISYTSARCIHMPAVQYVSDVSFSSGARISFAWQ